jgi:4-hydroxy-3-methylbut-2-enyl diphosphate reductase IspH
MEVLLLQKDGRCKWLGKKVIDDLIPKAIRMAANPFANKMIVIVDWISNDKGRVGVDLKWFRKLGVPAVKSIEDLPRGCNFTVVNTGYDSIVDQELRLREKKVQIVDQPCPFIRKIRNIFEDADPAYQYVYLCEPNHITVKNFASIFPEDMIMVQMENYQDAIAKNRNGKPLRLIPYVTFLQQHSDEIFQYIKLTYPDQTHDVKRTSCLWIHSKASPIREIDALPKKDLEGIEDALLVTTPGSTNKSLVSLEVTLQNRGLNVVQIDSLSGFLRYRRKHRGKKVLLVRSPIPNNAEKPILAYLNGGLPAAWKALLLQSRAVHIGGLRFYQFALSMKNRLFRKHARQEAVEEGLASNHS